MYMSPIEIMFGEPTYEMVDNYNNELMVRAIAQADVNVDKGELLKALSFDRGQYEKGYRDAMEDYSVHWIPVDDYLPEVHKEVLVTNENGEVHMAMVGLFDGDYHWLTADKIVAWMYLPKPYEENECDDE